MCSHFVSSQFSQKLLSENWSRPGGQSINSQNSTITDDQSSVYVVGSTDIGINNTDIIIQKFNPDGGLIWQQLFGGSANSIDAPSTKVSLNLSGFYYGLFFTLGN
jgi:hypothetical protein